MGSVTSNPQVNIQLLPAAIVDAYADRRDLIVGQIGSAGTAVDGVLNTNIETLTTAEVKTLFGATSFLTRQILTWMTANGGASPLDVIGMDEATSDTVAAECVVTFTGTSATSDGEYKITFVDDTLYRLTIPVTTGDTPTIIAAAVAAAVGALDDPVFTAAALVGAVTATATDVGTVGNYYGVKIDGVVPGITVTITNDWHLGETDPTLTGIFDVIEGIRYTGCLWPEHWNTSLSIPKSEFESRFNPDNALMDGTVFHGFSDTYANILTELSTENSQCIVYMGSNVVDLAAHKGPAILRPADWVTAEFSGIRARRLTTDAGIADYIISTSGGYDAFGGPSLASLPYFNTPLDNVPVTSSSNLFSATEQGNLEDAGYSTYGCNRSQNAMITGPVVTNWTTDAGGNPNVSFHYLNYVDTGSACREVFFNTLKSTFAQTRLTEGDLIPGRSMANAESIKAELLRIYKVLAGLALTQAGRAAESYFAQNTTVTVSLADRKATVIGLLPIVTQLGTINYSLQLSFTITGTGTQITV
jgi:phage tail sheath gpL-like